MKILSKLRHLLIPVVYAVAMFYATYSGFTSPYRNWDMIGYVGSVIEWQNSQPEVIYTKTQAAVKASVPEWLYKDLFSNPLAAEPKAFHEQLPIYQVKPLYNGLIWLVHEVTGVELPVASWSVSATCFAMLSVMLWFWRPRYMAKEVWLLFIVGLTYLFPWPMNSLACLSTPDSVATLLETAAIFCWIMRRSFPLFFAFSWIAIFARPDALILCSACAMYFAVIPAPRDRMPLQGAVALVVLSSVTYLCISRLAGNYGLERWFIYAFIDKTPYPAEATDHLTLQRYWDVLAPSFVLFVSLGRTITMLAFTAVALLCYYLKPADGNRMWFHLMMLVWACVTVRFLMFPAWGDDRYYFLYYLPILFAGGELIAPYAKALGRIVQAHRQNVQGIS